MEKIIDCGVVKYSKMSITKFSVLCTEIKMHPRITLSTFMTSQVAKICQHEGIYCHASFFELVNYVTYKGDLVIVLLSYDYLFLSVFIIRAQAGPILALWLSYFCGNLFCSSHLHLIFDRGWKCITESHERRHFFHYRKFRFLRSQSR